MKNISGEEIYIRNMSIIRTKSNIYEKLRQIPLNENIKVDTLKTKDGNYTMSVEKNNQKIFLHSKYKPIEEAKKWVDKLKIGKDSIIIVYGIGMAYHIFEMKKVLGEGNKLIIVEPNISVFAEAIRYIDLSDILNDENTVLHIGIEELPLKKLLNGQISWMNFTKVIHCALGNYKKFFLDDYCIFITYIKDIMCLRDVEKNTAFMFADSWQINMIRNIPYTIESHLFKDLRDSFLNKPAVIVSAGPSLNKNMHLLKTIKEKAVIICVDTAYKILRKNDIIPDFVVTVDGGHWNAKHFDEMNSFDIPLIYSSKSNKTVLGKHTGEKILAIMGEKYVCDLFARFGRIVGELKNGGSVACYAFDIAVQMGADPVIFIGQDLAYTDNYSHARGTAYAKEIEDTKNKIIVEDIYGGKLYTGGDLHIYLQWFENEIARDDSRRLYIDATEGGAKIKGTEIMTFTETIDKYCTNKIGVTEKLNNFFVNKNCFTQAERNALVDEFSNAHRELEIIKTKSVVATDLSKKLYKLYENNRYKPKSVNSLIKKLDKIDNYLNEKKKQFEILVYILQPMIFKVTSTTHKPSDGEQLNGMTVAKQSIELYDCVAKGIEQVAPELLKCISDLEKDE
ncbi:MAG: motility associated factor glycosyltransferase family protein [Alkaliphilus sp.]